MKSRWHKAILVLASVFTFSIGVGEDACAQVYERMPEFEQKLYGEYAFVAATDYESMTAIKRFWYAESLKLRNRKYSFALTGSNDCVLKVSISASELFADNDTVVSASADAALRPFLKYLSGPDALAKVIVATYTDNNGSVKYLTRLSQARSRNIASWLQEQAVVGENIRPYGHANKVQLNENGNVQQRKANRRVVLYLVPTKQMLSMAKKDKLNDAGINESKNQKINISKIWQKN